jgi:tetratricopeptide (TPR) repeat protein
MIAELTKPISPVLITDPPDDISRQASRAFQRGVQNYLGRDLEKALVDFEGVLRLIPDLPAALVNKGVTLGALGQSPEAIAVYDEVVRRYGDSPETALQEPVAKALFNKGVRLGALGQSPEAIAVYDEVIRRYGNSPETALQEPVAKALFNKGVRLGALGQSPEAIAVYDEVVRRYGDSPETALQEQVAKALVNKGVTLGALGQLEQAYAAAQQILALAPEDQHAQGLRREIVHAMLRRLVKKGFASWSGGKPKGSEPPIPITPGPPVSDLVHKYRR